VVSGSLLRGVAAELADLVLPRACAGCGVPGAVLCPRCAACLAAPRPAYPRRFPAGFPPAAAAGAYAGPVRPAIVAFKERGRAELAAPLGTALALAVAAIVTAVPDAASRPVLLVPLPASRAGLRARGRDHVAELAGQAVAELTSAGAEARQVRLLRRRGRVADSAGLTVAQRRANLVGSFVADRRPVPADALLVLVDDVVTSGATLTEAAAALSRAALPTAAPVLAAVVAATPRRGPSATRRATWGFPGGAPERPERTRSIDCRTR
jgi:predicted amidophosphoribosyltransferase